MEIVRRQAKSMSRDMVQEKSMSSDIAQRKKRRDGLLTTAHETTDLQTKIKEKRKRKMR
jgi:hypothetical protein